MRQGRSTPPFTSLIERLSMERGGIGGAYSAFGSLGAFHRRAQNQACKHPPSNQL